MSAGRELWRILCLHARVRSGLSAWGRGGGGGWKKTAGYALLALYGVVVLGLVYGAMLYPILAASAEYGLETTALALVMWLCLLVTLVFGVINLISVVFSAKDAEFYAALPVRGQSVFGAKLGMVYLTELGLCALILFPAGALLQMMQGFSPLFSLRVLVLWLLVPAMPLALGSVFAMPFIRLAGLSRRREMVTAMVSLALIVGVMAGQMALAPRMGELIDDPAVTAALMEDPDGAIQNITRIIPPARWGAAFLAGESGAAGRGFLFFLLGSLAGLWICLLLSRKLYYKTVLAGLESARGKQKGYQAGAVRSGSAVGAFYKKELRVLLRTPVYAMNALAGVVAFPVMLVIINLTGTGGGISGELAQLPADTAIGTGGAAFLTALGIVLITGLINVATTTTFSRDGRQLWLFQSLPVTTRTHVLARFLCGLTVTGLGCLTAGAAMILALGLPAWPVLGGVLMGFAGTIPMTMASMIPDAMRPKRTWVNEAEAMKQNINSIWGMLLALAVLMVLGLPALILALAGVPLWAVCAVTGLAALGAAAGLFAAVARLAGNMLREIE